MELVICVVLGAWISIGGWLAYKSLKKEYSMSENVTNISNIENNEVDDKRGVKK